MKKTLKLPKKIFRSIDKDSVKLDQENNTLEFSFSSETPYERWFGNEILSHEKDAVDFTRLKTGAPCLFNHDPDKYIGVVEDAWIEGKKAFCRVRFSSNEEAQKIFKDIQDGILKNVSVGYQIIEIILLKENKDGPSDYLVSKWMPYEVSIVTIPADNTVGIGRSASNQDEVEISVGGQNLNNNEEADASAKQKGIVVMEKHEEVLAAERKRTQSILDLGNKFNQKDLAAKLVAEGANMEKALESILAEVSVKSKALTGDEGKIGMTRKDLQQYSIVRAIRHLMSKDDAGLREDAGFEIEVSKEAAKRYGQKSQGQGLIIPLDVLTEQRAMTVGTPADGGNLVGTTLKSESFIDLLSKKSVLNQAGAMTLSGLVGDIAIPRQTGGCSVYWLGENEAPGAESKAQFDQVPLTPKTIGAFTELTRKLLMQSTPGVENLVRNDLARSIALEIDRVGLYGSGVKQPKGLINTAGINVKQFAATAPTFTEMVAMETEVALDNADIATMLYLASAVGRGNLKTTLKSAGVAGYIWENNQVNGYGALCSNQIDTNDYFFGNFSDILFGLWSGLELTADPFTLSKQGAVIVTALQDIDVACRHPESFCRGYKPA